MTAGKSVLFVDDHLPVLEALRRSLRANRHEWNMTFCSNAADALRHLTIDAHDVIVSDILMPDMSGIELLKYVRDTYPHMVRVALSGTVTRQTLLETSGAVAHQFLSKPCSREILEQTLARARSVGEVLTSPRLRRVVTQVEALPALPALYGQFLRVLNDEDSSFQQVAVVVSKDVGLTVKILQLANSAYFGLPKPVYGIHQAVAFLGLDTIRSLAVSAKLVSQFQAPTPAAFSLNALWRHSIEVGRWAHAIARYEKTPPQIHSQCMLAGMLHDIGKLVLATQLPDEYALVLKEASASNRHSWIVEQDRVGANHAQIGACLLDLWGFDQQVCDAVRLSHEPNCPQTDSFLPSTAVWAANLFTQQLPIPDALHGIPDLKLLEWKTLDTALSHQPA